MSEVPVYPDHERRLDVKHGKRDGRKHIPAYTDVVGPGEAITDVATPYQGQLVHGGMVLVQAEYENFLSRTRRSQDQLAKLRGQVAATEEGIARGLDSIAAARAELTEDEMLPRNHQELLLDKRALHSRRVLMRERRIALAEAAQRALRDQAEQLRGDIKEQCGRIDHEFAVAQAAARSLGHHVATRIETYWEALTQAHPDGRQLAMRRPAVTVELPLWTEGSSSCGEVTLPGQENPTGGTP